MGLLVILMFIEAVALIYLWITVSKYDGEIRQLRQKIDILYFKGTVDKKYEVSEKLPKEEFSGKESLDTGEVTESAPPEPVFAEQVKSADRLEKKLELPPRPQFFEGKGEDALSKGDMENWVGKKVIGVLASILVFIGLVFLGVLTYEHITETGKIVSMYLISAAITGLGV